MEKVIKIEMNKDKSISIFVDETEKKKILKNNRNVSAKDLFEIFSDLYNYNITVQKENTYELDKDVLDFFVKLIEDIAEQLADRNKIDVVNEKD